MFLACFESTSTQNQDKALLSDHFYPIVKHFYPNGSGLFQDDPTLLHSAREFTKCFDEDQSDVNHMLSYDLYTYGRFSEHVRQRSLSPSSKY